MRVLEWFAKNWFLLLQTTGIVGGLLFTALSFRTDAKARKIQNLLTLTEHHRSIWEKLFERPTLSRLLAIQPSDEQNSPTIEEQLFVTLIIVHLSSVYESLQGGILIAPKGLKRDIRSFFKRRIPNLVWQDLKVLYDDDFVEFVDAAMNELH